MAEVRFEQAPQVEPAAAPPFDYQRIQTQPGEFGALIGRGEQELGQGLHVATQFYGQIAADEQANHLVEGMNDILYGNPSKTGLDGQPMTGFYNLTGKDAMNAYPDVISQIQELRREAMANLPTGQSVENFERATRYLYSRELARAGSHSAQQSREWGLNVYTAGGDAALRGISSAALGGDADAVGAQTDALIHARVKAAQLRFGTDLAPDVYNDTVAKARADAATVQINSLARSDPARARQVLEANKGVLGLRYGELDRLTKTAGDGALALRLSNDALGVHAAGGAPAPSHFDLAYGDSIAVQQIHHGVGGVEAPFKSQGLGPTGSTARVGDTPQQVLARMQNAGPATFSGKTIFLSPGTSNNPTQLDAIQRQVDFLKKAGASGVAIPGVGPGVKDRDAVNAKLADIAKTAGFTFFQPNIHWQADGIHPADVDKLREQGIRALGQNWQAGSAYDPRNMTPVIRVAAGRYGIDPNVALTVTKGEGLGRFLGDGGTSGGAFQLHVTGPGGNALGDQFRRDTGLDPLDPKNEPATIDYALRYASQHGWSAFNGAARVGISAFQGIAGHPQAAQPEGTTPQQQPTGALADIFNRIEREGAAAGASPEVIDRAERHAEMRYNALQADQERQNRLSQQAATQRMETRETEIWKDAYSPHPTISAQAIASDPAFAGHNERRAQMIALVNNPPGSAVPAAQSYKAALSLIDRIRLPYGDPNKISDMGPIYQAAIDGQLNKSDLEFAQKQLYLQRDAGNEVFAKRQKEFLDAVKPLIMPRGSFGVADPQETTRYYEFQWMLDQKIAEYQKAGKNPADLIDPSKPDYIAKPEALKPYRSPFVGLMTDTTQGAQGPIDLKTKEGIAAAWLHRRISYEDARKALIDGGFARPANTSATGGPAPPLVGVTEP